VNGPLKLVAPLVVALGIAACNAGGNSLTPSAGSTVPLAGPEITGIKYASPDHRAVEVCPNLGPRYAMCDVQLIGASIMPAISGLTPTDYQTRYKLPSATKGSGQVVAIVDAYDNPNEASDLAAYRKQFNLGTATFNKYNQNGQMGNYPQGNSGWGLEEDLDIQMVAAVCPLCTIDLVEANSNSTADLETAEAEAVKLGAHIVSNSWGCTGSNNCVDPKYFDTPGVEFLASAGDSRYGTQAPAALGSVVSVGGTVLQHSGSQYSEMVWFGTGSGCATGITKPSWQHDSGCTYRTMNDVSAVAYNAAEYDTYGNYHGWIVVQGTSVASPMLGGVFGLAGNASSLTAAEKFWTQSHRKYRKDLWDITTGSNGTCSPAYLCTAEKGYDGPTGWGTPKGIKAF